MKPRCWFTSTACRLCTSTGDPAASSASSTWYDTVSWYFPIMRRSSFTSHTARPSSTVSPLTKSETWLPVNATPCAASGNATRSAFRLVFSI